MSPVLAAKVMPGWNTPIDGGRLAKDGKPLLGRGKTWRGLVGGAFTGGLTALGVAATAPHWDLVSGWDYGAGHPAAIFAFGALVGFMALVGDAVKSYFKRRRGKESGAAWVPFVQLDFVVFGLLAMVLGAPLLADGWVRHVLLDD